MDGTVEDGDEEMRSLAKQANGPEMVEVLLSPRVADVQAVKQ